MPDIKTEMSKVLSAWDKDAQQQVKRSAKGAVVFSITNNVSRETFNYVRDNPRQKSGQICEALNKRGFKPSSVGSLLTQFIKQDQMHRDEDGRFTTLVPEYIPLKAFKRKRVMPTTAKKGRTKQSHGIAALKVEPRVEKKGGVTGVSSSVVATAWDAETVINNIGLKQAHALYKELAKYFGG